MDIDSIFKSPTKTTLKRKLSTTPENDATHVTQRQSKKEVSFHDRVLIEDELPESQLSHRNGTTEEEEEEDGRFYEAGVDEDYAELLSLVDAAEDIKIERLDVQGVRRMLLKLEDSINKNQMMRLKYPNNPVKFGDSEADLDESIKHLLALSQAPHLYPELIKQNSIPSILGLLGHDNTDISIDVVELLNELLDEELVTEENEEAIQKFVEALIEEQAPEMLVHNLKRLDESNSADRQGIFYTLGVFENMISVDQQHARTILNSTALLEWLLSRIGQRESDSNRNYASELLAIFVQEQQANRVLLVTKGGMDVLLRGLAIYKRRDPEDIEVEEHVENLFNILCSVLLEPEGREAFFKSEGIELMLILLKEKKFARLRALKVISHAVGGHDMASTACAQRLVDARGLGPLFSAFMQKGNKKIKKVYKSFSESEDEEHIMAIFAALFRSLPTITTKTDNPSPLSSESSNTLSARDRMLFKFIDDNMEKVNRLIELRSHWQSKVTAVDSIIAEQQKRQRKRTYEQMAKHESNGDSDDDDSELNPDFIYLRRLDAGLFTVQMADLVIAQLALMDNKLLNHIRMLLRRNSTTLEDVSRDLLDYAKELGDEDEQANTDTNEEGKSRREFQRAITLARQLMQMDKAEGKQPQD
ncbi:Catenin-beta-like protein [Syncephalis fuscata]|nr:Catenin-beta-like protein [Syncephalis fuscata]